MFVVTLLAALVAAVLHLMRVPGFEALIAVPVTAVVAMCAMGIMARLLPSRRAGLVAMVPAAIPRPALVVWLTGSCEAAGAVGVLLPPTRVAAAACLAVLLVAVFPANVVDARAKGAADGTVARRIAIRGGEQLCFVALCAWILVAATVS